MHYQKQPIKKCIFQFFSDYKEYNTDTKVNFKVTMAEEDLATMEGQGLKKKFNLTSSINLSNMVSEQCFHHSYILVDFLTLVFLKYFGILGVHNQAQCKACVCLRFWYVLRAKKMAAPIEKTN